MNYNQESVVSWKTGSIDVVLGGEGQAWIRKSPNDFEAHFFHKTEILTTLAYQWCPEKKWILMPWHASMDLSTWSSHFIARSGDLQNVQVFHLYQVFYQLALQLEAVHQLGYLHGDLHPQNLLVDVQKGAQVIDWGHCQKIEDFQLAQGTPKYYSPEHWSGRGVSPSSEVFSLGLIFWECLWGEHVLQGMTSDEIQVGADQGWEAEILNGLQSKQSQMSPGLYELLNSWLIHRSIEDMDHLGEEIEILTQELVSILDPQDLQASQDQIQNQMKRSHANEILSLIQKLESDNRVGSALEYANYGLTLEGFQSEFLAHVSRLSALSLSSDSRPQRSVFKATLLGLSSLIALSYLIWLFVISKSSAPMQELESQFTNIQSVPFKSIQEVPGDSLIRIDLPQGIQGEYLKVNQRYQNIQSGVLFLTPGTYQVEFSEDSYYLRGTLLVHSQGYQWDNLQ